MHTAHLLSASDLRDRDWALFEPLLPPEAPVGRPRLHSLRIIRNAIFYELRTGGAWRVLPQAWAPWETGEHPWRKGRPGGAGGGPPTAPRGRPGPRLGPGPPPPPP